MSRTTFQVQRTITSMVENKKEPQLTYALNAFGKMIYINDVERGLSCNCRCPKCKEPLVARLGHEGGRQAHFAHKKDSDCHGSYMTALHKLAEQIIEEEKAVMAPKYKEVAKQKLSFTKVEVELRVERKDLQPDVVGVTEDGLRWFVEIRNTHEVDETKKEKLKESNITCLEIDVREQKLENLKSFILESADNREWINNPNYDAQIIELKRKRVSLVEEYLLCCTELTIPAFDDYDSRIISIKESSVLSRSDDMLFSQIKVISSDGIPYIFNICSQDKLETIKHGKDEGGCNELIINIDCFSIEDDINSNSLNLSWLHNYLKEKEIEEKVREYKNNPNYELKPFSDCLRVCKYRPFKGECIYKKDTVSIRGIYYVVCNKEKRQKDENDFQPYFESRENSYASPNNVKSQRQLNGTSSSDNLPFERYWTPEEFNSIISSGYYEDETGNRAEIIKHEIIAGSFLILYKDSKKVKSYCPYHIVKISFDRGNKLKDEIAVFDDMRKALYSFSIRSKTMKEYKSLDYMQGDYNAGLPF